MAVTMMLKFVPKIAKHVCQHGNRAAAMKLTISENGVRNMKKHMENMKSVPNPSDISMLGLAIIYYSGRSRMVKLLSIRYKKPFKKNVEGCGDGCGKNYRN